MEPASVKRFNRVPCPQTHPLNLVSDNVPPSNHLANGKEPKHLKPNSRHRPDLADGHGPPGSGRERAEEAGEPLPCLSELAGECERRHLLVRCRRADNLERNTGVVDDRVDQACPRDMRRLANRPW
jgi:hypothetical protein